MYAIKVVLYVLQALQLIIFIQLGIEKLLTAPLANFKVNVERSTRLENIFC